MGTQLPPHAEAIPALTPSTSATSVPSSSENERITAALTLLPMPKLVPATVKSPAQGQAMSDNVTATGNNVFLVGGSSARATTPPTVSAEVADPPATPKMLTKKGGKTTGSNKDKETA